jgi:integrase
MTYNDSSLVTEEALLAISQAAKEVKTKAITSKQAEVSVSGLPKLALIAYKSGAISLVYRGRTQRVTLGAYQENQRLALLQAYEDALTREEAGLPIISTRRMTLDIFFQNIYLPHIKETQRSWKCSSARYQHHIKPQLGSQPLVRLQKGMIERVLRTLSTKVSIPLRNRVGALLKGICRYAHEMDYLDHNPASQVRMLPEVNRRSRYLSHTELETLLSAVKSETNRYAACLVSFLLATGVRLSEALNLQFADVDEARQCAFFNRTKNGRAHQTPLSAMAMATVKELKALATSTYLFPSRTSNGPMSRPSRAWERMKAAAGIQGLTLHDLRRSHATLAHEAGASIYAISQHLNHSSVAVTARYCVLDLSQQRGVVDKVNQRLAAYA